MSTIKNYYADHYTLINNLIFPHPPPEERHCSRYTIRWAGRKKETRRPGAKAGFH
jgi:hypothetical protein